MFKVHFCVPARTRFECAHRQEIESILCAVRNFSARSAHRNRSVCVRAHPLEPPGRVAHTPRACACAHARTHTTHRYRTGPPGQGFDQGPPNQPHS